MAASSIPKPAPITHTPPLSIVEFSALPTDKQREKYFEVMRSLKSLLSNPKDSPEEEKEAIAEWEGTLELLKRYLETANEQKDLINSVDPTTGIALAHYVAAAYSRIGNATYEKIKNDLESNYGANFKLPDRHGRTPIQAFAQIAAANKLKNGNGWIYFQAGQPPSAVFTPIRTMIDDSMLEDGIAKRYADNIDDVANIIKELTAKNAEPGNHAPYKGAAIVARNSYAFAPNASVCAITWLPEEKAIFVSTHLGDPVIPLGMPSDYKIYCFAAPLQRLASQMPDHSMAFERAVIKSETLAPLFEEIKGHAREVMLSEVKTLNQDELKAYNDLSQNITPKTPPAPGSDIKEPNADELKQYFGSRHQIVLEVQSNIAKMSSSGSLASVYLVSEIPTQLKQYSELWNSDITVSAKYREFTKKYNYRAQNQNKEAIISLLDDGDANNNIISSCNTAKEAKNPREVGNIIEHAIKNVYKESSAQEEQIKLNNFFYTLALLEVTLNDENLAGRAAIQNDILSVIEDYLTSEEKAQNIVDGFKAIIALPAEKFRSGRHQQAKSAFIKLLMSDLLNNRDIPTPLRRRAQQVYAKIELLLQEAEKAEKTSGHQSSTAAAMSLMGANNSNSSPAIISSSIPASTTLPRTLDSSQAPVVTSNTASATVADSSSSTTNTSNPLGLFPGSNPAPAKKKDDKADATCSISCVIS